MWNLFGCGLSTNPQWAVAGTHNPTTELPVSTVSSGVSWIQDEMLSKRKTQQQNQEEPFWVLKKCHPCKPKKYLLPSRISDVCLCRHWSRLLLKKRATDLLLGEAWSYWSRFSAGGHQPSSTGVNGVTCLHLLRICLIERAAAFCVMLIPHRTQPLSRKFS